jgi:hypothetical protein
MIIEERCYSIVPGRITDFLALYTAGPLDLQRRIQGNLLGYFTSEIGGLSMIVNFWSYDSLDDRMRRREWLAQEPERQTYLAKCTHSSRQCRTGFWYLPHFPRSNRTAIMLTTSSSDCSRYGISCPAGEPARLRVLAQAQMREACARRVENEPRPRCWRPIRAKARCYPHFRRNIRKGRLARAARDVWPITAEFATSARCRPEVSRSHLAALSAAQSAVFATHS